MRREKAAREPHQGTSARGGGWIIIIIIMMMMMVTCLRNFLLGPAGPTHHYFFDGKVRTHLMMLIRAAEVGSTTVRGGFHLLVMTHKME